MFSLNANWYLIFGLLSFKGDNAFFNWYCFAVYTVCIACYHDRFYAHMCPVH